MYTMQQLTKALLQNICMGNAANHQLKRRLQDNVRGNMSHGVQLCVLFKQSAAEVCLPV